MGATKLPSQGTSFIGREQELADIFGLLADPDCRLLTIVGTGGIGKTRLALQAAAQQQDQFADGVVFVPLAPVVSVDLIPAAIASALHFSFFSSETPREQLIAFLRDNHQLLILDNFEHLLDGTELLSDLLLAAPHLKLLVTSRSRLTLVEEWVFSLGGLSYPTEIADDVLENYSGIALFVHRARQVSVRFSLVDNKDAVLAICRHAEGIPLALELAASWLGVLSCQQVAEHMRHQLDFLTTELRNVPERHRSLRSVFEWSWGMLTPTEQAVFMRLSVFHGGFDLEAAVAVADASLKTLAGLVDKSLILYDGTTRYDMHELLRQFAAEKLAVAGEAEITNQRHLDYFMRYADRAEAHLFSREQIPWFDRLEVEMDNLRAALAWSKNTEVGLQLVASVAWFFSERSYWNEGLAWIEQILSANPNASANLRAKASHLAGGLAGHFGDISRLKLNCQRAIEISQATGNHKAMAWALCHLGLYDDRDLEQSRIDLQESLRLFRYIEDSMGMAHCLIRLAWNAIAGEDLPLALTCVDEAALLSEQAKDTIMLGWTNSTLGRIARYNNEFLEAKVFFQRAIFFFRQGQLPDGENVMLIALASIELKLGNLDEAERIYRKALLLPRGIMLNHPSEPLNIAGLAHIALMRGQYERSAHLLAIAEVNWLFDESRRDPEFCSYEQDILTVRTAMGETAFATAWETGKTMDIKEAESYIFDENQPLIALLSDPTLRKNKSTSEVNSKNSLTTREIEILRLLADGLNSTEVAARLVLSVGTVRWYLKEIYSKLDVHSRSEALARAKALKIL